MLLSKLGELISEYQPAGTVLVIIGFVAVTHMCGINPDKLRWFLERSTHEVCGNSSRADVPPADFPSFTHIKHVAAPASKSYLHREIIAASLAGHELQLDITDLSDDILATYEAMVKLPNQPPRKNNVINRNAGTPERFDIPSTAGHNGVVNRKGESERSGGSMCSRLIIDCKESGTTLRFLLPVVASLGVDAEFKLHGRLSDRPISELNEQLELHGMKITRDTPDSLRISGRLPNQRLQSGEFTFDSPQSSQFISGLLFALPLLESDSVIRIRGRFESKAYVRMTLSVLRRYGIDIRCTSASDEWIYTIPGNQRYVGKVGTVNALEIEGDWSNAAVLLAIGALSGEQLRVTNLPLRSEQGDRRILDLLKEFGIKLRCYPDAISTLNGTVDIYPSEGLKSIDAIDASDCPDLVPIIALLATQARGRTQIYGAKRARLKESDRLSGTCAVLTELGADISETSDGLVIVGTGILSGSYVGDGYGDHRIIMMLAAASLVSEQPVRIHGCRAVAKSYPDFFKVLGRLGLTTKVLSDDD